MTGMIEKLMKGTGTTRMVEMLTERIELMIIMTQL